MLTPPVLVIAMQLSLRCQRQYPMCMFAIALYAENRQAVEVLQFALSAMRVLNGHKAKAL